MSSEKLFSTFKDPSLFHSKGFINGKWTGALDGKTFTVFNPATNEPLGTVADMGAADTKHAIEAADAAFKTWSKAAPKTRHDVLKKLFDLMNENVDDLGRMVTLENGKILRDGKGEVDYAGSFIEWFAEEAIRAYGEISTASKNPNTRYFVVKQPMGVVGAIIPWNFPLAMATRKIGPALAAGCTIVLKPSPETPYSALAIAELARRAGVPDGVVNIVTTLEHVKDVGLELCENKTVRKIAFTGSTPIGKLLYRQAAGTMKSVSIEAGGNAPFIVFNDANIDVALGNLKALKFLVTGQICVCPNRIFVQSGIYAEFAARLTEIARKLKLGDGMREESTLGPLIHSNAVDKVERHVKDAVQGGAKVLTGGTRPDLPGSFFEPTVLADVSVTAQLNREETFGPLAPLIKFETEEEVIRLANNSDMGLAGYIFAKDVSRIWRVAEALEIGSICVNGSVVAQTDAPFGGLKESGVGSEGGHGVEEYLNTKVISLSGL